jgi:hypothetical protein
MPFECVTLSVSKSVLFVKKESRNNPDLILKAYEYGNLALSTARESLDKSVVAEQSVAEALEALEQANQGGGGSFQIPTDQGADNFLAGDGTYKKPKEIATSSGNSFVKTGIGATSDILIQRTEGVIVQTINATASQLEMKSINTTSTRSGSITLYASGMVRIQASNGSATDTLEMVNGTLKFNGKKVLTET